MISSSVRNENHWFFLIWVKDGSLDVWPSIIMLDWDQAQLAAIWDIYPHSQVFLCTCTHIMDSHGLCNWYSQPMLRVLHNSYSSWCQPMLRFFLISYIGQHALTPKCMHLTKRVGEANQLQVHRVELPCYQESDRPLNLHSARFDLLGKARY